MNFSRKIIRTKRWIFRGKEIFGILLLSLFSQGCIMHLVANGPTHGLIYTDIEFAGEINPANNVKALKRAEGCLHSVMSLVAFGEAGAGRIAKKNGITRISRIDHTAMNAFIFYDTYCTVVYGE